MVLEETQWTGLHGAELLCSSSVSTASCMLKPDVASSQLRADHPTQSLEAGPRLKAFVSAAYRASATVQRRRHLSDPPLAAH